MSMFGTPATDAALEARVAQLEAALASLTGTVTGNAGDAAGAIEAVAQQREAGDDAAHQGIAEAVDGSVRRTEDVASMLGGEIVQRAQETAALGQKVSAVKGEAVQASVIAASDAIASDVATVRDARGEVLTARDQAQAAAQTALFGTIHPDYATGLAATAIGAEWVSYGPASSYATRWLKTSATTAQFQDAYPNKAAFDRVNDALNPDPAVAMAVDPDGLGIGGTLGDGTLVGKQLALSGVELIPTDDPHLTVLDPDGLVAWTADPAVARTFSTAEGKEIDALCEVVQPSTDANAGVDRDGLATWYADGQGFIISGGKLVVGDLVITPGSPDQLLLVDPDGLVIYDSADIVTGGDGSGTGSDAVYAARDAANVAYAMAGRNDLMPIVQQIERGKVNIILTYGQSLRRSSRGYPPLTTVQPAYSDTHVYSFGQACRPADDDDTVYQPVTSAALYPLLAVCHYNNGTLIDNAGLAAIGPDTAVPGESFSISAAYWLRQQCLAKWGVEEDADTPFVVLDCAVGGKSVAHLSKGATPNLYNRIPSGLTQIRDLPAFAGKEFRLVLVDWGQGENDYYEGLSGANPDAQKYQAAVQKLMDDIYADTLAIFNNGQKRPAVFIAQAGGAFTTDATNLHVGQAQLNLVTQVDGYFPTGPNYPVVNVPSAHPDNNGYRWLGQYCGRAWASVLVHGRRPNIVYPRRATWDAETNEIIIDFMSTGGAISEGHPFDGFTPQVVANLGISAKYGSAVLTLSDVRLVGAMTVAAKLVTTPAGPPLVQIGTKALDNGYIGLRCASRMTSPETYTFIPNAGQDPAANVPTLVGKPYNLDDWCWAASLQSEQI